MALGMPQAVRNMRRIKANQIFPMSIVKCNTEMIDFVSRTFTEAYQNTEGRGLVVEVSLFGKRLQEISGGNIKEKGIVLLLQKITNSANIEGVAYILLIA